MNKKEKSQKIISDLNNEYPKVNVTLDFVNPLELLVATILAAQCTDVRVNIVTQDLFKKYKKIEDYANADLSELELDIRSTGFYRNKAKNIKNTCQIILDKFNGVVPKTMEELLTLHVFSLHLLLLVFHPYIFESLSTIFLNQFFNYLQYKVLIIVNNV